MKHIFKSILALMSLVFVTVSCNTDFVGTKIDPSDLQDKVSFVQSVVSDTELAATVTSYDIQVGRSCADNAASYKVVAVDGFPKDICPSSVSFAAGEYSSVISIDLSEVPVGKLLKGAIALFADNDNVSKSSINVSLQKAYNWQPYGTVKITDGLIIDVFNAPSATWQVEALKAEGLEVYRILEPYGPTYPFNEPGDFTLGAKWDINATNPDAVTFDRTYLGFDWGYGEFNIVLNGDAKGKMENKVITFPKGGIVLNLPDYGNFKANTSGLQKIDLNL